MGGQMRSTGADRNRADVINCCNAAKSSLSGLRLAKAANLG